MANLVRQIPNSLFDSKLSYRYSPKSTHFKVEYTERKAYLTAVYRDYVRTPGSYYIAEVMSDELKEALIARFERGNEKALYPPPEED